MGIWPFLVGACSGVTAKFGNYWISSRLAVGAWHDQSLYADSVDAMYVRAWYNRFLRVILAFSSFSSSCSDLIIGWLFAVRKGRYPVFEPEPIPLEYQSYSVVSWPVSGVFRNWPTECVSQRFSGCVIGRLSVYTWVHGGRGWCPIGNSMGGQEPTTE